jgi:hypothetical protein
MPASDLDAIRARLAAYDAAHREPETPDALRRIMAASLHFPADLRALLDALDTAQRRIATLEEDLDSRLFDVYWHIDPHGGGWNWCAWCGEPDELVRYWKPDTFPHEDDCPLKAVIDKRRALAALQTEGNDAAR